MMRGNNGIIKGKKEIAIPPGYTIKEEIDYLNISQKELAERMDISEKHISQLMNGEVALSPMIAERLETVLGPSADFWLRMEKKYRDSIRKVDEEYGLKDIEIHLKIPYSSLVEMKWLVEATNSVEKTKYLRKYFEIVNLNLLTKPNISKVAYKKIDINSREDVIMLAWTQKAKLIAREIESSNLDKRKLERRVKEIGKLVCDNYKTVMSDVKRILNECGVILVELPHIRGLKVSAMATKEGKKGVIGIEDHFSKPRNFWFVLFHEIAHIIMGHVGKENGITVADEKEADDWARNYIELK